MNSTHVFAQSTGPAESQSKPSLFRDPSDGGFDISGFLSTRTGFLPIAMPITEPAVGYGLALGVSYFHEKPQVVQGSDGEKRAIMPSTTVLFGAATENETWGAGVGHLGVWDKGHVRYMGAVGYVSLNLDWFGKGDALHGRSISYTNDVAFLYQQINFQIAGSNFFIGPYYRFLSTDSTFAFTTLNSRIPDFELQSQISGVGLDLSYDTRDQPFSPTKGIRADINYSQQADWLASDFDYGKLAMYAIVYMPLSDKVVLGVHLDGQFNVGHAPFYDLTMLNMRGVPLGRYVDNDEILAEAELRWDITRRWSLVGFGGIGRVADNPGDLLNAENHPAVGAGFRYLIAEQYGLRMGVDVAHSDDDWAAYITVGTGWLRP
ncbi:MAG TPA: BamA/TamA family outer membrane protein [Tepidisphaeraceae bacterium]|nr:BamA/TamA family outer membrane protein [Tepidisphaeraceae bacterium]